MALLELPRALGDPRRPASIDALSVLLRERGVEEIDRVAHTLTDEHSGLAYDLASLLGHVRPQAPHQFVLATHFDVRPWADEDPDPKKRQLPIPGANDGSSGVAVLLELIPQLARDLPSSVGFTVVLFDGEELGHPGRPQQYCAGSRELAKRMQTGAYPILARAQFGIVLDMIGDRDLKILREPHSLKQNAELVDHVWEHARCVAPHRFSNAVSYPILDDHVFLTDAGIPSILLIDHDYPAWHTHADTIDQVSAASLGLVGEVVRRALVAYWRDALSEFVSSSAR